MLHVFTNDISKHVEGIPDEDGLLQSVRPAQERFRLEIRKTAPNFRPYERKYAGRRHMSKVKFLTNEEGHEEVEGSDDESDMEEQDFPGELVVSQQQRQGSGEIICIDEVLEMAQR